MPGQSSVTSFLREHASRTLYADPGLPGLGPLRLYLARPGVRVEVALYRCERPPGADAVRAAWQAQWTGRATGVLAVVAYESDWGAYAACTGLRDDATVRHLPLPLVEALAGRVLDCATTSKAEAAVTALLGEGSTAGP